MRPGAGATDFLPSESGPLVLTPLTTSDKLELRRWRERLPWLIGAGGLLVYLLTLNNWMSLSSLGTVARTAGWLWQPEPGRPLSLALFFPFRLLPATWLPLALNLFSAILAGLVLVQLARTVALLRYLVPSDDPLLQGKPVLARLAAPAAWMPPLLAAVVCGLQFTFWENATSATGEMISLLCFAYALRCLLEFHNGGKPSWLYRCAAVYAAGMADNWLLVGYAPVLLASLVWIKGFGPFLQPRFLFPLLGCGLIGLSAYLLLPALLSWSPDPPISFGAALTAQLKSQQQALAAFRHPTLRLLVLTALLPAVLLAIRWRSHAVQFADDTPMGNLLIKATGHSIHALFFVGSLWIALNPAFSSKQMESNLALLPYYYLWALVTGYGAGYFLLFQPRRPTRPRTGLPAIAMATVMGVMSLFLLWKNLGEVWITNRSGLRDFARQRCDDLPPGESVVLSEDPRQLLLVRAELAARGREHDILMIETPSLVSPHYHQFMTRRHAARWPEVLSTNRTASLGPPQLLTLVSRLVEREPVFYLHPSSGFFLESYALEPQGSVLRLVPRAGAAGANFALPGSVFDTNEKKWREQWDDQLRALAGRFTSARQNLARWSQAPFKKLRLAKQPNATMTFLGAAYSKALNDWAVQARRAGHESPAREWFRRALELNPDNVSAAINLEYATRCEQGDRSRFKLAWAREHFGDSLGKHDHWWEVMSQNGPVDEPTFLSISGQTWLGARLPRQAADAFARCAALSPDWLLPKLWQAQSYQLAGDFATALKLTEPVEVARADLKAPGLAQLLLCRTATLRGLGRTNDAASYLEQFVAAYGTNALVLNAAATLYAASGQFAPELALREQLLHYDPGNSGLLLKKGLAELRLTHFAPAIATFTQVLTLSPEDRDARLLRAVAHLSAGQLAESKADYQALLNQPGMAQRALFGLGGVAWREHDTNAVIRYYQQFLSNSAALSPQFNLATERLQQVIGE